MTFIFDSISTVVAFVLFIPVALLLLQVCAAVALRTPPQLTPALRPCLAVLVPAHDEAKMIERTLRTLLPQLEFGDRLLVVADNCTDDTAEIAKCLGAEVVVRDETVRRGKGFALAYGVGCLARTGHPEVVVIVDADCQVAAGAIQELAVLAHATGRPVQGDYVFTSGGSSALSMRFSEFALRLKNHVRALGSLNMGLPCPLTGSGMAIPWSSLRDIELSTANIVEDLALGIDLALAGTPPLFCPTALISSPLPSSDAGRITQRKRWEQGHLAMIKHYAPLLLWRGLVRRRWTLFAVALDMCVPPLALLSVTLISASLLSAVWWLIGGAFFPFTLLLIAQTLLCVSIGLAWWAYGRHLLSPWEITYIPIYVLKKIPLYIGLILGKRIQWVRSDRS
jgi:cellulose synthase/poly-beta-1,6-N-acetylglucosamine synthase-like glycosyltransferase